MAVALGLLWVLASPPGTEGPSLRPLVVLDPGHGGHLAGAKGVCGLHEKDVTLAVAKELAQLLEASQRARVKLTRTEDEHVELEDRSRLANELGAALFVSIHANASSRAAARGVETFFLSRGAASRRAQRLAERENEGKVITAQGEPGSVASILQQLSLSASHRESQRLAMSLQEAMEERLHTRGRGVLQAPFLVLLNATMPAALVEIGFLTHPEECTLLTTRTYQSRIAQVLAAALLAHLDREARALAQR